LATDFFQPTSQRSFFQKFSQKTGIVDPAEGWSSSSGELRVGFTHFTTISWPGDGFSNNFARSGLLFDLSKLSSKEVSKAVLHLQVDYAKTGRNYATDHHTWNYADAIAGTPSPNAYDADGPDVALNVTPIVQSWANSPPRISDSCSTDPTRTVVEDGRRSARCRRNDRNILGNIRSRRFGSAAMERDP